MLDYKEPCFVTKIKQDGRIKSLGNLLNPKNPFLPEINKVFAKVRHCEYARYTAYILIDHCEMHVPSKFSGNFVVQCKENVKNNFLVDILDKKIPELQEGKNLAPLLFSVIYRKWVDEYRKYTQRVNHEKAENKKLQQQQYPEHDDFWEKLEMMKQVVRQTVFAISDPIFRITVKMWLPYIFDYNFDPLETRVLENRKQIIIATLQQELEQQIEDTKKSRKKYYVSPEFIAQKLCETRDCIDQRISRFKKRLQNRLKSQE